MTSTIQRRIVTAMKKLFGWLVVLALLAGLFFKADTILDAAGQPDLADKAAHLRDGLIERVMGAGQTSADKAEGAPAEQTKNRVSEFLADFKTSMGFEPDELSRRAVETFKGAAGLIPEDFAAYYESLKAQGEKHATDVTQFALTFSEHYSEEIAPELVGYWNEQIASGKLAKDKLELTKQALNKIRKKMQPLLTDHLRVLARLEQKLERAEDAEEKESIKKDMEEVEADIQRAFKDVPADAQVLNPEKKASERLAIQIKSSARIGASPTAPAPGDAAVDAAVPGVAAVDAAAPGVAATADKPAAEPAPEFNENKLRKGVKPWLGTKYLMGTNVRGKTTDCSGFVGGVMNETFKLELPRTSRLQYKFGDKIKKSELLPGDLVFFDMKKRKRIDHVGVYVGKDDKGVEQFAHASFSKGVRYDSMKGYYKDYYWGAARVLEY